MRPLLPALACLLAFSLACAGQDNSESTIKPTSTPSPAEAPAPPVDDEAPEAEATSRCGADGYQEVGHWQGEYPSPIVQVTKPVILAGYASPCDPAPTTDCPVDPGVYHPWGAGDGFVTLRTVDRFVATKDFTVESIPVKKGETIEIPAYLSEGFCQWSVRGEPLEAMCPGVEAFPLDEVAGTDLPEIQMMQMSCGSWVVVDDALMELDGVQHGEMIEYGTVGPAN